jgi:N6-adenosine-specific RNA methylase IME4
MNTVRVIVEAYCTTCGALWSRHTTHDPSRAGRTHAERTGHRVRITRTIVHVYNEGNGKQHGKQSN